MEGKLPWGEAFLVHSIMDLFCERYLRVYPGRRKGAPGGKTGLCKGPVVGKHGENGAFLFVFSGPGPARPGVPSWGPWGARDGIWPAGGGSEG